MNVIVKFEYGMVKGQFEGNLPTVTSSDSAPNNNRIKMVIHETADKVIDIMEKAHKEEMERDSKQPSGIHVYTLQDEKDLALSFRTVEDRSKFIEQFCGHCCAGG
jgi:hypothetical protein